MKDFLKAEPAMLLSLLQAAIIMGVSFGLPITDAQTATVLTFCALLIGVITRHVVYSPASVKALKAQAAANAPVQAGEVPITGNDNEETQP